MGKCSQLLIRAAEKGFARFEVSRIARAAEVSEAVVRSFLKGERVREDNERRLRAVLGDTDSNDVRR